eukprot:jgi/Ulvmu1/2368/UM013_0216.1
MGTYDTNEENCPGHVNQGAVDLPAAGPQAFQSGSGLPGPQLARRKGRSFGASVIAHLGPTQSTQPTAGANQSQCAGQAVAQCTPSTPIQHASVSVTPASPLSTATRPLSSGDKGFPSMQQSAPGVTCRRSHGAAMLASLTSKNASHPSTPPAASMQPAVCASPPAQCLTASVNQHEPSTDVALSDADGGNAIPKSQVLNHGGNASNQAAPAKQTPAGPHSTNRQAFANITGTLAAPVVESSHATETAVLGAVTQQPVAMAPDRDSDAPAPPAMACNADDCPEPLESDEGADQAKAPEDAVARDDQKQHSASGYVNGPAQMTPLRSASVRPNGSTCKPVRGSHGAAMLLQLCSKLPGISPNTAEPAGPQKVDAAAGQATKVPAIHQDRPLPQGAHGHTQPVATVRASQAATSDLTKASRPAAPQLRRSAGASIVAVMTEQSQGGHGVGNALPSLAPPLDPTSAVALNKEQHSQGPLASAEKMADQPAPPTKRCQEPAVAVAAASDMQPSSSGAVCASVDIWIRPGAGSPRACDADSGTLAQAPATRPKTHGSRAPAGRRPPADCTAGNGATVQFMAAPGVSQTDSETVRKTLSMFLTDVVSHPNANTDAGECDPGRDDVAADATPAPPQCEARVARAGESPDAADVTQVTPRQHHRWSTLSTPLESGSASSGSPGDCGDMTASQHAAGAALSTAELQHLALARSSLKRRQPVGTASPDAVSSGHKRHRHAARKLEVPPHVSDATVAAGNIEACAAAEVGSVPAGAGVMHEFCNSDSPMICGTSQEEDMQRSTGVTPKLLAAPEGTDGVAVSAGTTATGATQNAATAAAARDAGGERAAGSVSLLTEAVDSDMLATEDDDTVTPCPGTLAAGAAHTSEQKPSCEPATAALWQVATGARPPSVSPLTAASLPCILQHNECRMPVQETVPVQDEQPAAAPAVGGAGARLTPAQSKAPPPQPSATPAAAQQSQPDADKDRAAVAATASPKKPPSGIGEDSAACDAALQSPTPAAQVGGDQGTPTQQLAPAAITFKRIALTPVRDARKRRGGRPVKAQVTTPVRPTKAAATPKRVSPRLLNKHASPGSAAPASPPEAPAVADSQTQACGASSIDTAGAPLQPKKVLPCSSPKAACNAASQDIATAAGAAGAPDSTQNQTATESDAQQQDPPALGDQPVSDSDGAAVRDLAVAAPVAAAIAPPEEPPATQTESLPQEGPPPGCLPEEAPTQEAPPQEAPPQEAPLQEAPPQHALPQEAPPQHALPHKASPDSAPPEAPPAQDPEAGPLSPHASPAGALPAPPAVSEPAPPAVPAPAAQHEHEAAPGPVGTAVPPVATSTPPPAAEDAVEPLSPAPSLLLQNCEPPGLGEEDSPCTSATAGLSDLGGRGAAGPPPTHSLGLCKVQDAPPSDDAGAHSNTPPEDPHEPESLPSIPAAPLPSIPAAPLPSIPAAPGAAAELTDTAAAAAGEAAAQHAVPDHDLSGTQAQASCGLQVHAGDACVAAYHERQGGIGAGLSDVLAPLLEHGSLSAAGAACGAVEAGELQAEVVPVREELPLSPVRAIVFDPEIESPLGCAAPAAPPVQEYGPGPGLFAGQAVASAEAALRAAAAAPCERRCEAGPSSSAPAADRVMVPAQADAGMLPGFRQKRVLSPSKVAARARPTHATEAMHHASGPKLSRGHLFQAAAMKGASPTGMPTSSPPCGSAPTLSTLAPPGSYHSPVLHLTSPPRPSHNSSSPLFSAAVGVLRSPNRMHGGRSYHASTTARGLTTSPQRPQHVANMALPYGVHLQPHPPPSPVQRSPAAHGIVAPVAPRSPIRTSSGASTFHHGMEDGQLPSSSPLLGPSTSAGTSRRWQWRRGRGPGGAAPLGASTTAVLRNGLAGMRPRRRRCRLSPAAPAPSALDAMRTAFLDLQLATAASRGEPWATLSSSGVPFPDPLDLPALSHKLAAQAVAASGSNPAADVTAALQAAREEWAVLQASRFACWQRRSGSAEAPASGDAFAVDPGAAGQPAIGSVAEGQPRRGLLKRSPLPSVFAGAPPLAPMLGAGLALAMTPPGSLDRDDPSATGNGSHPALEPPTLPLFQQSAPIEGPPQPTPEELPRQRSVRFSDQAAVKHYENSEEPSRVAGEPVGLETVATRSPQKSGIGCRRKKRRVAVHSGGGCAAETSTDTDEVEEGEVAEGSLRLEPELEFTVPGSNMYAL